MRWASVVLMIAALSSPVSAAQAQKDHVRWFKVAGKVLDKNGRPIQWGRVCLKDTHAHNLRIKPIGRDGHFDLTGLDARLDYEIYAEQGDTASEKVQVSGSPKAAKVVVELKLNRTQDEK
jgi:hypothetical protein